MRTVVGDRVLRAGAAIGVMAAATLLGVAVFRETEVAAATSGDITAIGPSRLVDTRAGETTVDGQYAGQGRVAAGNAFAITVGGRAGIPAKASAVVLNVTAVRPDGPGHLTVYPCGTERPNVSNVNYAGGDVAPNAVVAKVGTAGKICVFSLRNTDLVVDVSAYVPAGGSPIPIDPVRNLDTRDRTFANGSTPGRLRGGTEYQFTIAGQAGIPKDAAGAMMNITAVRPDGPGYVTVYPCGTPRPNVSNINYSGGDVAPNAVLSKIGARGQICVFSLRDTDLLIDLNGYVPVDGTPSPVVPVRFTDTRWGGTTIDGDEAGTGRLTGGREYKFQVGDRRGHPGYATDAAVLNVTAVRPDGPGHITVYPCGIARPNVSSINYRGGDVAPNAVFTEIGDKGQVCVYSLRDTDLIIDVNAFVATPTDGGPVTTSSTTTTTTTTPTPASTEPPSTDECIIAGAKIDTIIEPYECNALVALYTSTGGPDWSANDGWNTATDPCDWYGVSCSSEHVDAIALPNNNLNGSLPASIGELIGLKSLVVYSNRLTGTIPTSIGDLVYLSELNLSGNGLTGSIPASIGNLTYLEDLVVGENRLSGPIPAAIGNLGSLYWFDANRNLLTGPIPSTLGNLSELYELNLDNNQLSGPIPGTLGNLKELEFLQLFGNQLSGSIPTELGGLSKVTVLDLAKNQLTGSIPASLADLDRLEDLDLNLNLLTGSIPSEFGNFANLGSLRLNYNQLSGPVPPSIRNLNLYELTLFGNRCLTAADPALATWLSDLDPDWNNGCTTP